MTVKDLREALNKLGIEYFVAEKDKNLYKVNIWLDEEETKDDAKR